MTNLVSGSRSLRLAQIGCGGMGLRHIRGLAELARAGHSDVDLVAVCDVHESSADFVAKEADALLGFRPRVYTDVDRLLEVESRHLDAISIVTDPASHHDLAMRSAEAGCHVAVEKPLSASVKQGTEMVDAARKNQRLLSVFENYRRDPLNRLAKAILDHGDLGDIRIYMAIVTDGTDRVQQVAAWRHLRSYGGSILEFGVHRADLLLYFLGKVDRVFAETALFEPTRRTTMRAGRYTPYYRHRVASRIEREGAIQVTAEDTALSVIRLASGAIAYVGLTIAAPGRRVRVDSVNGAVGCMQLSPSRSGKPLQIWIGSRRIAHPLNLVPKFELDAITTQIFGSRRLDRYELDFDAADRKLLAIEFHEFAEAIRGNSKLEVDGVVGLASAALCFAMLESGKSHRPVAFDDVATGRENAYQEESNEPQNEAMTLRS